MYTAYTEVFEEFPSFEAAVQYLETHPGSEGRNPTAVSMITASGDHGVNVDRVDGEYSDPSEALVYCVTVSHEVMGNKFNIRYMVEFSNKEEAVGEDGASDPEVESGGEEEPGQLDESVEQPGEGTGEAPSDGTEIERWESDGGEPDPSE